MSKNKITFDAFQNVSYDEDAGQYVRMNGEIVGGIVKVVADYGITDRQFRVARYSVRIFAPFAEDADRTFDIERDRMGRIAKGAASARSVHKAAKDYVRHLAAWL